MGKMKSVRKFDGKPFNFAEWVPTKAEAQTVKKKWGDRPSINVRVVKAKHGYTVWVRI